MSERLPKSSKNLERASIEGNVRFPQQSGGIVVSILHHVFSAEDSKLAVAELIAPIAIDEALVKRTQKANAQHAHHGISKELSLEDVQHVQIAGNVRSLDFLREMLNVSRDLRKSLNAVDMQKGEWASESDRELVQSIQAELTPENISFLRDI